MLTQPWHAGWTCPTATLGGLPGLQLLPKLAALDLAGWEITNQCVEDLLQMPQLTSLNLGESLKSRHQQLCLDLEIAKNERTLWAHAASESVQLSPLPQFKRHSL